MKFRHLMRSIYIFICILIAWYAWDSISHTLPQYKNEALFAPTIVLYGLTMPISLVFQLVYTFVATVMPLDQLNFGSSFINWLIKTWLPLVAIGYLQYFVVLPYFIKKK